MATILLRRLYTSYLKDMGFEDIQSIKRISFTPLQKRSFRGALTNEKLTGISVMNAKGTTFNKINVSSIGYLCLGKNSFHLDTFEHSGDAFSVMVAIIGNAIVDPSSNHEKVVCILIYANALRKGVNSSIFCMTMWILVLIRQSVLTKTEFNSLTTLKKLIFYCILSMVESLDKSIHFKYTA